MQYPVNNLQLSIFLIETFQIYFFFLKKKRIKIITRRNKKFKKILVGEIPKVTKVLKNLL